MNMNGFIVEGNKSKPIIGLFPDLLSLGETIPLLNIANEYLKLGGEVVFFSHGGKYEHLIKDIGYKIIKLSDIWKGYTKTLRKMMDNGVSPEKLMLIPYKNENLLRLVKEEIEAFNKSRIKLLISSFILSNSISARVIKVPLVVVISGVSIPPYYASDSCTFPENYENVFTKMVPSFIKNRIFRWYILNCKYLIKDFNKIAKEYYIPRFRNFNEILLGDHTFICDDINFLGLTPSKDFPRENFIGPIFRWSFFKEQKKEIDSEIKNHLNRQGKSIFLSMGTSGDMQLFLKIIEALNKTDYNVIAVYSNILKQGRSVICQ